MKRHLSIFVILIVVAAMLAIAPASADEGTIIINGGVFDWDDSPVDATVILSYGGVDHTDMTDSEGQYTFLDVPADTYYTIYAFTDDGYSTRLYDGDTALSGEMRIDLELDYVSIYGRVIDVDDSPASLAEVYLYYGEENQEISADLDGQFVFKYVPTFTDFLLYAVGDGVSSNEIDESTGDSNWYDIVLRYGSGEGPDTTYIEGFVIDQNGNPIDGARVILEYGEDEDWMDAYSDGEDDGYYYFEDVPVGVDFWLFAYIEDTDFESNEIEGVTTDEMGDQILVIEMVGAPAGSPTPAPAYSGPWTINNTEWYYNDSNPFPAPAVVSTPVPTPAPTAVPTSAPGTGGNGGVVTATPTATPSPTPTPVPSSSENTFLSGNLWWILLLLLVAAAIGVWYVTKEK